MDQETLPELIVFLDSILPRTGRERRNIQFCTDDGLGEKLERLLRNGETERREMAGIAVKNNLILYYGNIAGMHGRWKSHP